jgi:hypothetical protein
VGGGAGRDGAMTRLRWMVFGGLRRGEHQRGLIERVRALEDNYTSRIHGLEMRLARLESYLGVEFTESYVDAKYVKRKKADP